METISISATPVRLRSTKESVRVHVVDRLAGVLLEVDALDADLAGDAGGEVDEDLALADDRVVELADLVALRQVGVEVVLAVEARDEVDLRLEPQAGAHRLLDAVVVDDRQHARHGRVDEARRCVLGSAPKAVEAPEKSLAFEATWAWTSMPITISQSPLAPAMIFGSGSRIGKLGHAHVPVVEAALLARCRRQGARSRPLQSRRRLA